MTMQQASSGQSAIEVVAGWKVDAATVLDVRPVLEQGGEPFVQSMEAAGRIPPGRALVLVAPFEPVPLYGALGARGFSHTTQCVTTDEWVVRFTRAS
jgi:Uncharacterized conserved protein (DUF2249)